MLTIAILLILFIGAYSGYKNGVITGLIRSIGYTITFIFAMEYYETVNKYIYMIVPYPSPFSPVDNPYHYYQIDFIFSLDQSYYYLVSFLSILLVGWFITRLLSKILVFFTEAIIVPEPYSGVGGAIIGFLVHYVSIFLLLFILSTIPYDLIQNNLSSSWVADSMLTSTPKLSAQAYQVFIADVHEEELGKQPTMDIDAIMNPEEESENEAEESE